MAVTLASAGQMLAKSSQTVLEGMQPAERITSGRVWGHVGWPVSSLASHPLRAHSTLATAKPQPWAMRMDGRYTRTPGRSVAAQEALTAPAGLQPIWASLLQLLRNPFLLP